MAEPLDGERPNFHQKAENDEDDDYMADLSKFIPVETPQTSKPKKQQQQLSTDAQQINSQSSRKKAKIHNWQEQRKVEREWKQLEEDKKILASIDSAIPQSNIGFKLLQQMGYKPGSALGKDGSGRAEPVGIDIRRSRAGIGRDDPLKEKLKLEKRKEEKVEKVKRTEEEMMVDFGWRQKSHWKNKRVGWNYEKAKAALDQLENVEPVVEPKKEDDDGEEEEEEEEEVIVTKEDLLEILMKLRDEHHYCLFCGCQYNSTEDLLSNCPGIDEDDH